MTEVVFTEPTGLGIIFQEDVENGGMCEIIQVHRGSAAERLGVQVGWLVERVEGKTMEGRKFREVTAALKNPQRPLVVQFALQSMPTDTLGGGFLYDVPLALPSGRVVNVSVATQDNVQCAATLKRLLLDQHGPPELPVDALHLVTERQEAVVGFGGTRLTGVNEVIEIGDLTPLMQITRRIDRGELLSVRVAPPHRWPGESPPASATKWSPQSELAGASSQLQEIQRNKTPASPLGGGDHWREGDDGINEGFELSFDDGSDDEVSRPERLSIVAGMQGLQVDRSVEVGKQ